MLNINKFIEERIDSYIKNSDYIELNYQREFIKSTVKFFIYTLTWRSALERFNFWVLGNFDQNRFVKTRKLPYLSETKKDISVDDFLKEQILWEWFEDFDISNEDGRKLDTYASRQQEDERPDILTDVVFDVNYYPMPNVHLDVWLWKTLIWILSSIIILKTMLELNKHVEELIKKNVKFPYTRQNNKFLNMSVKDFQINFAIIPIMKREIEKMIYKFNLQDKVNINLFLNSNAKKLLDQTNLDPNNNFTKLYFELFDKVWLAYIDWAYQRINNIDHEQALNFLLNTTLQWYSMESYEVREREKWYKSWEAKYSEANLIKTFWEHQQDMTAEYTTTYQLPFFIVDELASKKTFIYKNDKDFIKLFNSNYDDCKFFWITWVWLSASSNKAILPTFWYIPRLAEYYSSFLSKKAIIDELIQKGVYKESWFLYKNIYMNQTNMFRYEEQLKKLWTINKEIFELVNANEKDLSKIIEVIDLATNDFLEQEKYMIENDVFDWWKNLENFMNNLTNIIYSLNLKEKKEKIRKILSLRKEIEKDIETTKEKLFYQLEIEDIINDKWLTDLHQMNTIYLLDTNFRRKNSDKQLNNFVKYLEKEDVYVFTVKNYSRDALDQVIAEKKKESDDENARIWWIALVWYVDEMWKGLNLQDFDNIVILYANQCSFDDIYQALGRIDRLGVDVSKEKEAIFVHFTKDEEFFDKLLWKRENLSYELRIEDYQVNKEIKVKDVQNTTKKIETQIKGLESFINNSNIKNFILSYEKRVEEDKISEEKYKTYLKNRDIILEILVETVEEIKQNIKYITNILISKGDYSGKDFSETTILEALSIIQDQFK